MKTMASVLCGLLSAATLVVLATTVKAQSLTIKYVGDEPTEISTTYVTNNAMRHKAADVGAGQFDVIDRIDNGVIIFLDHNKKTYKEISVQEFKAYVDEQSNRMNARMRDPRDQDRLQRMGVTEDSSLEKLGPGETIASYATDRYLLKGPVAQAELWITQSLQFPATYYRDFNILNSVSTPFGKWDKILEVKGVILRRVVTMRGGMKLSETATSVDMASIPASVFETPADYKKVPFRLGENRKERD
jgi:hypothetical protein